MRARKKPWAQRELGLNEVLIENAETLRGNWHSYFNNDNGIHLEIGCGKGRFIVSSAAENPDVNYVAIEREKMVIVSGLRTARTLELKNIGFVLGDAKTLPSLFDKNEISRIYINFCDPWTRKKKWAKRRLTHPDFLDIYKNLLPAGGSVFMKTDNAELFNYSVLRFAENGFRLENVTRNLHENGVFGLMTEYEEKFHAGGTPICRLEAYI
ncbi:tRNA (guanine-N(7)-)-methyltransferase [Clostridia bacterium]|nr:tRNA (guanine-N(7)-)-methyltransferase [Clostridia bacterium]